MSSGRNRVVVVADAGSLGNDGCNAVIFSGHQQGFLATHGQSQYAYAAGYPALIHEVVNGCRDVLHAVPSDLVDSPAALTVTAGIHHQDP